MTVTLNLKPEVETGLLAQAQANGMTLEEYLLSMIEGAALLATQRPLRRTNVWQPSRHGRQATGLLLTCRSTALAANPCTKAKTTDALSLSTRIFSCVAPNPPILSTPKQLMEFPDCCDFQCC